MANTVGTAVLNQRVRKKQLPFLLNLVVRMVQTKPLGAIGGAFVVILAGSALVADMVTMYGYNDVIMADSLIPPFSPNHIFGTDNVGRDLFSRMMYGAQISMYVGVGAVVIGVSSATMLGVTTGYFGGKVDSVLQRFVDAWMAFPPLIILMSIMSILGAGVWQVIFALGLGFTFGNSRVIRSAVLSVKELQYVDAARSLGATHSRIILFYIIPNIMAPIIVISTLGLGGAILAESTISFLGFGIPPPFPSWGQMLSGVGIIYMYQAPWMALWPGLAISLAVFGFNMMGDALRDLLDPRLRGGR